MREKVKNTLKSYHMLRDASEVSVALSGGADSVCLLHILWGLQDELNIKLSALHFNHKLRGEESERDEAFVRELCHYYSIPLTVGSADIRSEADRSGESIELAARNIRYSFFKANAKGLVATAHTASDNLETVIYNITRGSGTRGVSGIPAIRDIYIRPLIDCTRAEVEEYIEKNGLSYVTDSSNLTDEYSRNFIRHNIIPKLKELNPAVEHTVAASREGIREDADFIDFMAQKIYAIISKGETLDAELLSEQHPAVAKRVLAMLYRENIGNAPDAFHIKAMYEVLISGGKQSLPGGFSAERDKNIFRIVQNEDKKPATEYKTEIEYGNVNNLFLKNSIDRDKIRGQLVLRTRAEGDSIRLCGRGCTKSLKKLFNELKIPNDERDILPIAADDEGVLWIYSVGVAERVAPDAGSENILTFKVEKSIK